MRTVSPEGAPVTARPSFPPLFRGERAPEGLDPFAQAVSTAALGCDAGLIVHRADGETLSAALVLAPEDPLEEAMAMVFAAGIGFSDALGALAPPEVGVHLEWPGGIRVNGARAGRLRAAASGTDPNAIPDWLVVGLEVRMRLPEGRQPGDDPAETALVEEGCAEVDALHLLESWSRHTLVWINTWLDDGMARLHAEWRARAHNLGETMTLAPAGTGTFVGLDERGGALLRDGSETHLIPLTTMLER